MEVSRMYITGWADLGENPSLADKKAFIAEVEGAFPCIEGLSMFPIIRSERDTGLRKGYPLAYIQQKKIQTHR